MNILNLSHPLTPKQLEQIQARVGGSIDAVINPHVHFDVNQDFVPQVITLLDSLQISPERWQGEVWLVLLPSLNHITAILLAEMHGRTGKFPTMLRLRPVSTEFATEYELAEIINLQRVREEARERRGG